MPYKSEAQRRYFNANREKLEAEGVDVDEWNESSKGKKLPEKKASHDELLQKSANARLAAVQKLLSKLPGKVMQAPKQLLKSYQKQFSPAQAMMANRPQIRQKVLSKLIDPRSPAGRLARRDALNDTALRATGKDLLLWGSIPVASFGLKSQLRPNATGMSSTPPAAKATPAPQSGIGTTGSAADAIGQTVQALKDTGDFFNKQRMGKQGGDAAIKSLVLEKLAGKRGLWDNIHAKRKRGEKPAKPGDKDYPDAKSWKKTTKEANIKGLIATKIGTNASKLLPGAGKAGKKVIAKPSQWQEFLAVYNDPRKLDAFISKNLPNRWPFQGKQGSDNAALKALVLEKIAKGRCWDGYEPVPGKDAYSDDSCRKVGSKKKESEKKAALKALVLEKIAKSPAWQREEGKSESGGLNAKGRASLKAQGQDIKAPVTQKNPKGEAKGRKASFCARMGGMKKKLTSSETANDPDSRINKALRKWNC